MDIKLRDNIDSGQFSKLFPNEMGRRFVQDSRSEIDGVTEKPSSHACNELNGLQTH